MLQQVQRAHRIERLVGERQISGVPLRELDGSTSGSVPREFEYRGREVEVWSRPSQKQGEETEARADVEQGGANHERPRMLVNPAERRDRAVAAAAHARLRCGSLQPRKRVSIERPPRLSGADDKTTPARCSTETSLKIHHGRKPLPCSAQAVKKRKLMADSAVSDAETALI